MKLVPRKESPSVPGFGWAWWRGSVSLTCPHGHQACFGVGPKGHQIEADGTVTPSAVCPTAGCDFHEFVRLEGWTGEEPSRVED